MKKSLQKPQRGIVEYRRDPQTGGWVGRELAGSELEEGSRKFPEAFQERLAHKGLKEALREAVKKSLKEPAR